MQPERVDIIAVTHGHGDHVGDTIALSTAFAPEIVAQVELKGWLGNNGANVGQVPGPNKGGTQEIDGIAFTLVNAFHSSSSEEGDYTGESCGIVIRLEDGTTIYFAGDTCVFGDMALIARIYEPTVAVLPIGDHFTMGPREAAVALELLGNPRCVPCHWGRSACSRARRSSCASSRRTPTSWTSSGRYSRAVRERWFGSTGRKVPEIALEGEADVEGALVLDAWEEHADELHAAFERGQPVVIRAKTPNEIKAALARPEVACVLVTDRELLDVDLVKLTYG